MDERQVIRTLAERLREERIRAKLTQPALAAIGGVSKTTQSGYESALHPPDALYLGRVENHGIDSFFVVTGQRAAVRAGSSLDWELLADLLDVLDSFEREHSTRLDNTAKARLLQVLYAASVGVGRIDPIVAAAVLKDAA
jgi:transcriptional regulator with XRE-family HTH domain